MKNEGRALYRLAQNPMEQKFHDAWLEENRGDPDGHLLEYLMGDGTKRGEVSDRDAMVAATVIQWLGSPVGQRFVEGVLTAEPA